MNIETIHTLPEMEKVEDGFQYPEKYHNKLYTFKDQYILFREASYDTFPKLIIETVVAAALENISEDVESKFPNKEEMFLEFEERMNKNIQPIESGISEEKVKELIHEEIANAFQNVNRVIGNMNDKIAKMVELEDLQKWRAQIEQGVNNLFLENTSNYPEDSVQNVLGRLDKLENGSNINEEQVVAIIHKELKVVKDGIKDMVNDAVKSIQPNNTKLKTESQLPEVKPTTPMPNVNPPKQHSEKVKFTELAVMKELGFSIQEIAEAKQAGII